MGCCKRFKKWLCTDKTKKKINQENTTAEFTTESESLCESMRRSFSDLINFATTAVENTTIVKQHEQEKTLSSTTSTEDQSNVRPVFLTDRNFCIIGGALMTLFVIFTIFFNRCFVSFRCRRRP